MKVKILKGLLSIYGAMVPGMTITVPEHIALNWIKNGIAECEGDAEAKAEAKRKAKLKEKPEVIPEGMYWCTHCEVLHREDKKIGKRHLKYR